MNPDRQSSGSQFYIVQGRPYGADELNRIAQAKGIQYSEAQIAKYLDIGGTPQLDMDYSVFGEITDGIDVIDKITAVQTQSDDRPTQDIKMKVILLN